MKLPIIILLTILAAASVWGAACTTTPNQNSCSVSSSLTLVPGTYYANDTGGGVGAINIAASNVVLDCSGSTIIGNSSSSYFIVTNAAKNITIKNCIAQNYSNGMKILNTNDTIIQGFSLTNFSAAGITLQGSKNITVQDSYIYQDRQLAGKGVTITTSGNDHKVQNTTIIFTQPAETPIFMGIENTLTTSTSMNFSNNTVSGGYIGIQTYGNNTVITNNVVKNSSWNGIQYYSYGNTVYQNTIQNYRHHGIDTHNDLNVTISGNTVSSYNTITNDGGSIFSIGDAAIFLAQSKNDSVHHNTILVTQASGIGVAIEGGNQSYSNVVHNNTVQAPLYCIYDSANNTFWHQNSLSDCATTAQIFGNYPGGAQTINRAYLLDNTINTATAIFRSFTSNWTNYNVSGTLPPTVIVFPNSLNISLAYSGTKNFIGQNNSASICSSLNCATYTPTAGQTWSVNEYNACTMPQNTTFGQQGVNWCDGQYWLKNGNSFLLFNGLYSDPRYALSSTDVWSESSVAQTVKYMLGNVPILPDVKYGKTHQYCFIPTPQTVNQNTTININMSQILDNTAYGWSTTQTVDETSLGLVAASIYGGIINYSIPYIVS